MARYPGAVFRGPVPNMAVGGMTSHRLFVLHIEEGTEGGTDAWQHNPAAHVSSNFGNPKPDGTAPDQFVDTDDRAWAQAAYNDVAISIEHEGNSGDSLTPNQLENAAQILAWAHRVHGTKLQVTDDPNGEGIIGHGQLGVAGGNHPDCPGTPILGQRQAIVDRAIAILTEQPQNGDTMYQKLLYDGANRQQHFVYVAGATAYHRVYDEATLTMSQPTALPSFATGALNPAAGIDAALMMGGGQLHVFAEFANTAQGTGAHWYLGLPVDLSKPEPWGTGVI